MAQASPATRRAYRHAPEVSLHTRQRRDRTARQLILADKRRMEFLRALSMRHTPLSADTVLWMEDLLERARLVRYHYEFKHAERTITDDLFFNFGTVGQKGTKETKPV